MGYRDGEHDKEDTASVTDRDRLDVIIKEVLEDELQALCVVLQSPAKAPATKEDAKPHLPITSYDPHSLSNGVSRVRQRLNESSEAASRAVPCILPAV
jgi:hypothetical protein